LALSLFGLPARVRIRRMGDHLVAHSANTLEHIIIVRDGKPIEQCVADTVVWAAMVCGAPESLSNCP